MKRLGIVLLVMAIVAAGCDMKTESGGAQPGGGACHPSYEGACLDATSSDYDCEDGSGNGPDYTGTVRVVGADEFDLDRDGDGIGCD